MNLPGGWELVLVVLVIMVLFGYKRLPDATRSIGRSMRIFKAETKGLREDDTTTTTTTATTATPAPSAQPLPPAPEQPAPAPSPSPGQPDEQVQHRQP